MYSDTEGLRKADCTYRDIAAAELAKPEVLDDSLLHHEAMLLLRDVFPLMKPEQQRAIVLTIKAGPNRQRVQETAEFARQKFPDAVYPEKWAEAIPACWIRDRLQIVAQCLDGPDGEYYRKLVAEYGLNDHPDFQSYHSSGTVSYEAPISESEWRHMSAEQCVEYMVTWQHDLTQQDYLRCVCPTGLARLLEESLKDRWEEFLPYLGGLIERSRYAAYTNAVVEYVRSALKGSGREAGADRHSLDARRCEEIIGLAEIAVRRWSDAEEAKDAIEMGDSRRVCVEVLGMIGDLLVNIDQNTLSDTGNLFDRVRPLLLGLCDHTNPTPAEDDPSEEHYAGFRDPVTVSMNHLRPMALRELLRYSVVRAKALGLNGSRWLPEVREKVSAMLSNDPAYSVRCVLGQHWDWLYYLEENWARSCHALVFPMDAAAERYFLAALDGYITGARHGYNPGYDLMRPLYRVAIKNAVAGNLTRADVWPVERLGRRLAGVYWLEIEEYPSDDEGNPLSYLYSWPPNRLHWYVAEELYETCRQIQDKETCLKIWAKARRLWEVRLDTVKEVDRNEDFTNELTWFVHFLNVERLGIVPGEVRDLISRSIGSLGSLPRDQGLCEIFRFVVRMASDHIADSVSLLRQALLTHGAGGYFDEKSMRHILQAATTAAVEVRREACAIVDMLGKGGHVWAGEYLEKLRA